MKLNKTFLTFYLSQVVKVVLVSNPFVVSVYTVRLVGDVPYILPLTKVELSLEKLWDRNKHLNVFYCNTSNKTQSCCFCLVSVFHSSIACNVPYALYCSKPLLKINVFPLKCAFHLFQETPVPILICFLLFWPSVFSLSVLRSNDHLLKSVDALSADKSWRW